MKGGIPGVLALDTSNYTTSVAVVDRSGCILLDRREALTVRQGERGLRQSHALFQHIQNLPRLIEECFEVVDKSQIAAVAVSDRPRSVEGSYMPVFSGGLSFGRTLSAAMGVPLFCFSHQEGHLAAGAYGTGEMLNYPFLAFHLSGGTTELLFVEEASIKKIGGTRDLSFGQVIDRVGVLSGLPFPAGSDMDKLALKGTAPEKPALSPVHFNGLDVNLSGVETQAAKWIAKESPDMSILSRQLFTVIAEALVRWAGTAMKETGCRRVLFTGGVASSTFIRKAVEERIAGTDSIFFGRPSLSSDNAVGVGLLGAKKLWP